MRRESWKRSAGTSTGSVDTSFFAEVVAERRERTEIDDIGI